MRSYFKIIHNGRILIDSDIELSHGMKLNHVFKKIRNVIELEINKVDEKVIVKKVPYLDHFVSSSLSMISGITSKTQTVI